MAAALAAALVLLPFLAFAEPAAKPISDAEVAKLIRDWPAVAGWFKERSERIATGPDGGIPSALFLDKEFAAFIGKRGWAAERFSYVTGQSLSLLAVVALERQNPDAAKQFDDAIAQVEASDMSAEDKAQAFASLNEAKASMLSIPAGKDIDQAELRVVRGRYDELMKLVDKPGDE